MHHARHIGGPIGIGIGVGIDYVAPFNGHFPLSPQQGCDRLPAVEGQRAEQAMGHHRADLARARPTSAPPSAASAAPEEALTITSEAVMLYRGLTDTDPTAYRGLPAGRAYRHLARPRGASMTPKPPGKEADLHSGSG
jgi:hypothetical protein